jgi:hypothetical protein
MRYPSRANLLAFKTRLHFFEIALGSSAIGTYPIVGKRIERRSRLDAAFPVSLSRIVDITADRAYPLVHDQAPFDAISRAAASAARERPGYGLSMKNRRVKSFLAFRFVRNELFARRSAHGAFLGRRLARVDIPAQRAFPFLLHDLLLRYALSPRETATNRCRTSKSRPSGSRAPQAEARSARAPRPRAAREAS